MKKLFYIVLLIVASTSMVQAQKYFDKIKISSSEDSLSYCIGYLLANNIAREGLPINADIIGKAFKDVANSNPALTQEKASEIIERYYNEKAEKLKTEQLKKQN